MPTAAKLVAALAFAAVGWMAADAFRPLMPDQTRWGVFLPVCAAVGVLCGWRVMGPRVGRGWGAALSSGLSTSAVLLAVALAVFALREMILRSMARRYDGVLEAVVAVFGIMLEYVALMGDVRFLAVLVVGGLLGGLAAEAANRRWR